MQLGQNIYEGLRCGYPLPLKKSKLHNDALNHKWAGLVAFMVLKEWQMLEQVAELNAYLFLKKKNSDKTSVCSLIF